MGNIQFGTESCAWRFDIGQKILWIMFDFLDSLCVNTMYTTDNSRPKCVDFSCKQYIIWKYSDILTQKNYTWVLDIVQKSLWILSHFLLGQNVPTPFIFMLHIYYVIVTKTDLTTCWYNEHIWVKLNLFWYCHELNY